MQRRSKLIATIRAEEPRPASMDDEVWRRLDRISKDLHREEVSQRMKCANAYQVNLGRTGP